MVGMGLHYLIILSTSCIYMTMSLDKNLEPSKKQRYRFSILFVTGSLNYIFAMLDKIIVANKLNLLSN